MLEEIKARVCLSNKRLKENALAVLTWGNVSEIDREKGLVVIKPSGVDYDKLTPEDMVVTDMEGNVVEGRFKPSSDLPTHLELYKAFSGIGGITHTHSKWATVFAQAGRILPGQDRAEQGQEKYLDKVRSLLYNQMSVVRRNYAY